MIVHISNLGQQITVQSLEALFSTHGEIRSISLVKDPVTGHSYAYLEMPDDRKAEMAISKLHGAILNRQIVSVQKAEHFKQK
jgi:RNA recognition motif-containing protein